METEFFSSLDSLQVISLVMSILLVTVAIYRWLIIRWQQDVDLREYVFMHALPSRTIQSPFSVRLDVPFDQEITLVLKNESAEDILFYSSILSKGTHEIEVPISGKVTGDYALVMRSEGQEDIKLFLWIPEDQS